MSDDSERRKAELRKRLRMSRYPRRRDATFTDENGHNPWILEDCATCKGRGSRVVEFANGTHQHFDCVVCEGRGTRGEAVVRYYPDDGPAAEAVVDAHGWITCPRCQRRFSTRYPSAAQRGTWTGRRHLTCGQLITLVTA
ncbi:hypothetical protein ACLESO_29795 [Pyxidicoccus sp. 3LG]